MNDAFPIALADNGRFRILSCLGQGGMGVVYEAFDNERKAVVALKTLRRFSGEALLRFKAEFRAAQRVQHPNLVTLGELLQVGESWFFTMEKVDGSDFISYVRPQAGAMPWQDPATAPSELTGVLNTANEPPPDPSRGEFEEQRLRATLPQLARGLKALHAAGLVHRDIKPSNVRVTAEGRLVILDFGLVRDIEAPGLTLEAVVVGTAEYMSPEQASTSKVEPASDWYAVGIMLYQALSGRLPFAGNALEMLRHKANGDAPRPSEVAAGIAADLDQLCADLTRKDPGLRASGDDLLERLGSAPERAPDVAAAPVFLGRERELASLRSAFAEVQAGQAVVVLVEGESGIGKTTLVEHFTTALSAELEPLVFAGRCYEREWMAYKALDSIVDAIARHLSQLQPAAAASFLPRHIWDLARVFPVLQRVVAVAAATPPRHPVRDPQELRTRVFAAFREMLDRLAEHRPVVIAIDDLQWADPDGVALLIDILRPPNPPRILAIATVRSESGRLSADGVAAQLECAVRRLRVERLPAADARELALGLLAESGSPPTYAEAIAEESLGHPLFIGELVRHVSADATVEPRVRLDDVVRAGVARLPPSARSLLELIALTVAPTAQAIIAQASGLPPAEFDASASLLNATKLTRSSGSHGVDALEPYHDRVRDAVLEAMDEGARRDGHEKLARALAASHGQAEALAVHYREAGRPDEAAEAAVRASELASEALAFERSASLIRFALELDVYGGERQRELRQRMGEALANAGRGPDAAAAYAEAARGATPVLARTLHARAADQYLRSGHIDEGLKAFGGILATLGMTLAATPHRALASLLYRRLRCRLRGTRFGERAPDEVDAESLMRVDICFSVAAGLSLFDPVRGADFQARHLLLALAAGEPMRVTRALGLEAAHLSSAGASTRPRVEALLAQAQELAERIDNPHAIGLVYLFRGSTSFFAGRWRDAVTACERAFTIFRERCRDVAWEQTNALLFSTWGLAFLGELGELKKRIPDQARSAWDRGDSFASVCLQTGLANLAWLAAGDIDGARRRLNEAAELWAPTGFNLPQYWTLLGMAHLDLYVGAPARSRASIARSWQPMRQALFMRVQHIRIEMGCLRGRVALACAKASGGRERAELLAAVHRDAHRLTRERSSYGTPLSLLLEAGAVALGGDAGNAARLCREAEHGFEAADMRLHEKIAARRRGVLIGGDQGTDLVADADLWMAAHGVAEPQRLAAVFAPGFDG